MPVIPRIIAGEQKGIRLKCPKGRGTRPTTDRVKESVFNILMPYVKDAKVLDLFAGTGNLGIEALSRGAKSAVFIDNNNMCVKIIWDNLLKSHLDNNSCVYLKDYEEGIRFLSKSCYKFDMIFIDPPYGKIKTKKILEILYKNGIIEDKGMVIVEKGIKELVPTAYESIILKRTEKYGDTQMCFYVNQI